MADNHHDATGVLVLDRVTPVIQALFGGYRLDPSYPGNGRAYFAEVAQECNQSWERIQEELAALAQKLGVAVAATEESPVANVLLALAGHFKADQDEQLLNLIEHHDFEDSVEPAALFVIASSLNDGHGLRAIELEGCWSCSKPRLFEFGGQGSFISKEVQQHCYSSQAIQLGNKLFDALRAQDTGLASRHLCEDVRLRLDGIQCERTRAEVTKQIADALLQVTLAGQQSREIA